jgi:hypothetical protein
MMRSFIICTLKQMLLGRTGEGGRSSWGEIRYAYKILVGKPEGKI